MLDSSFTLMAETEHQSVIDPQLKLILLSQRLTAMKRRREYDFPSEDDDITESLVGVETDDKTVDKTGNDAGTDDGNNYNRRDDDKQILGRLPRDFDSLSIERRLSVIRKQTMMCGFDEYEEDDHSQQQNGCQGNNRGDEEHEARAFVEGGRDDVVDEGEDDSAGDQQKEATKLRFSLPSYQLPLYLTMGKAGKKDPVTESRQQTVVDYLVPEFLHDITKNDPVVDDGDYANSVSIEEELPFGKADAQSESSSSDEKKIGSRKKSAKIAKMKSKKPKSGLNKKLTHTFSAKLLRVSDDADITMATDGAVPSDALFHRCVCALPWGCSSSSLSLASSNERVASDAHHTMDSKKPHREGKTVHGLDDYIAGWLPPVSTRGAWRGRGDFGGRAVSSAGDASRRKRCVDPLSIHRNSDDSAKYAFKHYQDWEHYVQEYRRHYTVRQTGQALRDHALPEGGGRREAVVIVRTLSDSLLKQPRLQEYTLPEWDDFTDLNTTPMRPLQFGPCFRGGRVPDLGVTWLSAAASASCHQDPPMSYRLPATSRHVKLSAPRPYPADPLPRKRPPKAYVDVANPTPRIEALAPHDAGIRFPGEPIHLVEDFRRWSKRSELIGADMRPIGCRLVTTWRPSETRVKSAGSKKVAERIPGETTGENAGQNKADSKKNTEGGIWQSATQSRTGLLKLFTPPRGIEGDEKLAKKKKTAFRTKNIDVTSAAIQTIARANNEEQDQNPKVKPATTAQTGTDALKWTVLPGERAKLKESRDNQGASKGNNLPRSRNELRVDDQPVVESRSALKSGLRGGRPSKGLTEAHSPQTDLLLVRGESKQERSNRHGDEALIDQDQQRSGSAGKDLKDHDVFGKARIKLVAPYAKPLSRDNVLVGSPYATSPCFGSRELNAPAQ